LVANDGAVRHPVLCVRCRFEHLLAGGMIGRAERLLTVVVLALAGVFVLVPLLPALLGRGTLIDVGALSAFPPFRADVGAGYSGVVTCRGDTIDYYLPGMAEIKRSLFAGHFPTWAPYEVGGAPLASLPNPRGPQPDVPALLRAAALAGAGVREAARVRRGHRRDGPVPAAPRSGSGCRAPGRGRLRRLRVHAHVVELAAHGGCCADPGPVLGAGTSGPGGPSSRRRPGRRGAGQHAARRLSRHRLVLAHPGCSLRADASR